MANIVGKVFKHKKVLFLLALAVGAVVYFQTDGFSSLSFSWEASATQLIILFALVAGFFYVVKKKGGKLS